MQAPGRSRMPMILATGALIYLVSAVFWPILGFEFVDYDVHQQLIDNPHVHGLSVENLQHIFTSRCILAYYPIRTLSFAVDYQFWGLNPMGFKLTNGLIHLTNVLLVFWLILRFFRHPLSAEESPWRRRDIGVAAFSAGLFAVHPVVVEPVAWVAGREELLMTLGALGCIHFQLAARRLSERDKRTQAAICYAGAALCCLLACLSNAVAAVIPLLIVACEVLTLTRPRLWRIVYGTSVLWVLGLATIVIKKFDPIGDHTAGQGGVFSVERLAFVLKVYWLNLKAILWPTHLAVQHAKVFYRGFADPEVILGGMALGLTCFLFWKLRRRPLLLLGLFWFGLALGPAVQIMPHHIPRADRFLYLPLVGLAVAVAMGLRPLGKALKGRAALTAGVAAAMLGMLLLVTLSAGQVQTWQNSVTVLENCLKVDAKNILARTNLANVLAEQGQFEKAIRHYFLSTSIAPDDLETLKNFALLLATCREEELRNYDLAVQLAERACQVKEPPAPATVMILAEVHAQAGRPEMTITTTERAIQLAEARGDSQQADTFRRRLKQYLDDDQTSSPVDADEATSKP